MPEIDLSRLDNKFQLVVQRMRQLNTENQKLKSRLSAKEIKISQQETLLEELEEKVKILKITSPDEQNRDNDGFRKEMRSTIHSYIREIDHCIASLNK